MTDPGVRRALARLAEQSGAPVAPRHRAAIDRASAATTDLDRAVAFVDGTGLTRLREAVRAAERADARLLAARGRRALRAFEQVRSAADGAANRPDPPA